MRDSSILYPPHPQKYKHATAWHAFRCDLLTRLGKSVYSDASYLALVFDRQFRDYY